MKRLRTETSGGVALIVALAMPVFVGGLGLGTEIGLWYYAQQTLQDAADVSAYAAAVELRAGRGIERIERAAAEAAARTGHGAEDGTLIVASPPISGAFQTDPDAVEVVASASFDRLFSGLFIEGSVAVTGRAVARISAGYRACILTLDPTASGALTFTGSADTSLSGCSIHANSLAANAAVVGGSARVLAPCASTAGGISATEGLKLSACTGPVTQAEVVPDPYRALPAPSQAAPCAPMDTFNSKDPITISPGRYCDGLTIRSSVTMSPGLYIVERSDFAANAQATVRGEGVTLYLTKGATLALNGGATFSLQAPEVGDYAGVLIFVDRNAIYRTNTVNGNADSAFNGAIYAPSGNVTFLGGSSTAGGCVQVVARTVTFSGNSNVGIDCTASRLSDIRSARHITLEE